MMACIDDFIAKLEKAIQDNDCEQLGDLVQDAVSTFSEDIPTIKSGLDRHKARMVVIGDSPVQYDNNGDARKILGKLKQYKDSRQAMIDEKYGTATLSTHIERCKTMIADHNSSDTDAEHMCYEMASVYSSKIEGFTDELSIYPICEGCKENPKEDLTFILEKLTSYRDDIIRNFNAQQLGGTTFHVEQVQNTHQTVSLTVSFEQTIEQIDSLSTLNEDEKDELKRLLFDVKESQKKDKAKFLKAAKTVANWVFDKGIEALPAVLTYILQVAQSFN